MIIGQKGRIIDLIGVLIGYRHHYIAMASDIAKMYNTIKLSPLDQNTHRFLWRHLQTA